MKLFRLISLTILGFVLLLKAHGQNNPALDPYRNFVGHWSGVVKVNPTNMPAQVDLTITESKNGKKMIWNYVFGTKGQEGYGKDTKTILLDPAKQKMVSEWQNQDSEKFTATGLDEFVHAGYRKFIAIPLPASAPQYAVIIELQPSTLSYTWTATKSGVTSVYSYFDFQRTPLPINKTP